MPKFEMTAKKTFHNAQIEGEDVKDGTVMAGGKFTTQINHAKDLERNGLADPVDAETFAATEREPEPERPSAIAANRISTTTSATAAKKIA